MTNRSFCRPSKWRNCTASPTRRNIPTICFGLRSDFQGKPFPGAAQLLTLADDLEEIKTICACGRKATMNIRLDGAGQRVREGAQVEIGGNDRYLQVCARCFYQSGN